MPFEILEKKPTYPIKDCLILTGINVTKETDGHDLTNFTLTQVGLTPPTPHKQQNNKQIVMT